jgi:hypothetical protein
LAASKVRFLTNLALCLARMASLCRGAAASKVRFLANLARCLARIASLCLD